MDEEKWFEGRVIKLNDLGLGDGRYVLYWMQQSQRSEYNHALEYAAKQANELNLPLIVIFGLTEKYPDANLRHYAFMLEGLAETRKNLETRGVKMIVRIGDPPGIALKQSRSAALLICDRGYLKHQKAWRAKVARNASCAVFQVESDVVAPVSKVSKKAEFAARTIRPKIHKIFRNYLVPVPETSVKHHSLDFQEESIDLQSVDSVMEKLDIDQDVPPVGSFLRGGSSRAKDRFKRFLENSLQRYDENSNQPQTDDISYMSPYLHFGQISPVYLSLAVEKCDASEEAKEAYLEQLIVRRELAVNFVEFTPDYDRFRALPDWALATLMEHKQDDRPYRYTRRQMENAQTHDKYWNAAMREMKHTGFMHNYMRMYWGKKILQWCNTPEYAFRTALYLNNKYFLDGRDPNSYTGVAWLFGLHDRPFMERKIFGKVRYMASSGLERKFDPAEYIKKVEKRVEAVE